MENRAGIIKNDQGQSLVEFILLLAIIVGISFTFMRVMNGNLADVWERYGQLLILDTDNKETLQIR